MSCQKKGVMVVGNSTAKVSKMIAKGEAENHFLGKL